MIRINDSLSLNDDEIQETFVRASGPGGQNVNKVSSAVRLRFDVRASPSLPAAVRERLERLAGQRLTQDGVIIINAQRYRSQERNRADALERLVALILAAAERQIVRRATRPTAGSKRRRLDDKAARSTLKRLRSADDPE